MKSNNHQDSFSLTPRALSGTSAYLSHTPGSSLSGGYKISKDFAMKLRSNSKSANDNKVSER